MPPSGRRSRNAFAWTLVLTVAGCSSSTPVEAEIPRAHNNLRNLTFAYAQATTKLGRPPKDAEELAPFLKKFGDPKEILSSPYDGAELVVAWGVDLSKLASKGGQRPIWVYEKNAHDGKRWAVQERWPVELSDEQFKTSNFVPELK